MIIGESRKARISKFSTNYLKANRYKRGRTIVQCYWEERQQATGSSRTETQPQLNVRCLARRNAVSSWNRPLRTTTIARAIIETTLECVTNTERVLTPHF